MKEKKTITKTCYLMPGFGLDSRIFKKLALENTELVFMEWLDPIPDEALVDYAQRCVDTYKILPGENTILIGHSFGGMLVQTIASLISVKKVILLASVKSNEEKPQFFKLIPFVPDEKWVNRELIAKSIKLWGPFHGFDTPELMEAYQEMTLSKSDYYFKWGTERILEWDKVEISAPIVHIHGEKDRTLPFNRVKDVIKVAGVNHLLMLEKPDLISSLLNEHIASDA